MMRGNLGISVSLGGQKLRADRIQTGVLIKEPPCHLRLARQTAKVDYGTGVRDGFGADGSSFRCCVGGCNAALRWGDGWEGVGVCNTRALPM